MRYGKKPRDYTRLTQEMGLTRAKVINSVQKQGQYYSFSRGNLCNLWLAKQAQKFIPRSRTVPASRALLPYSVFRRAHTYRRYASCYPVS